MHNSPHVNKQRWCNRARCVSGVNLTRFVCTAMWPFVKLLSPLVNKPNILTYTSVNKTVLPGQLFTPELLVMSQLQHNTHRPHRQTCRQTERHANRQTTHITPTHTRHSAERPEKWAMSQQSSWGDCKINWKSTYTDLKIQLWKCWLSKTPKENLWETGNKSGARRHTETWMDWVSTLHHNETQTIRTISLASCTRDFRTCMPDTSDHLTASI